MKKALETKKSFKNFSNIASIVVDSFKVFSEFKAEYESFKKVKKCDFQSIAKMEKELFSLKEATHALVRAESGEKKEIRETDLYDLIVSSIFHELLHLKEYIYILDKYEPSFDLIEKKLEDRNIETFKKDFLRHSREMVGEAKLGLPLKIQGINQLVEDAVRHLVQIIKANSYDGRFIRSIYMSSELVEAVYGEKGLKTLYEAVYEGGFIEGCFLVAESFSKSGFYEEALNILERLTAGTELLDKENKQYKLQKDYLERAKKNISALKEKQGRK
ncbi:MAG: hypothetical protein NTX32_04680 [Candidatus Firestonebacteria bacterium]|nr:hypothetical protein [Candidatus Firestonebacteria bacterium]